jgi:xylose isomerase
MAGKFRFTFGPWNISEGGDPFGPKVRKPIAFEKKLSMYKKLGFDGVQFHDDDAVPGMDRLSPAKIIQKAEAVKKLLNRHGLKAEFVAPRLWEDAKTIDGGWTSNDPKCRKYAMERSKRTLDIAHALGAKLIVIWFAREGTYIREAKDSKVAVDRIAQGLNVMLEYDKKIKIAIEPKPNEPMDQNYIPTTGHAIALGMLTVDPSRIGVNIESAHAILAGLDPSDEMGFALAHKKLWSVHLNDQGGLKFDEDKAFGSENLRRAFNQVRILDQHDYGKDGQWVGLDVKAMRTQKDNVATKHLRNSREVFMRLLQVSRSLNQKQLDAMIKARDYEELDLTIIKALMGK